MATIARRVEGLRDLRYRRIPVPQRVTAAQARRDGLKDYDASEPPRVRAAEEEVLELLGLHPARTSLRGVAASLYGQGVAGYYDPRTKRLKVVSGAATSTRALTETVIAHELTHALEDQHYGLDDNGPSEGDDRALARLALDRGDGDRGHDPLRRALHRPRRAARRARSARPSRRPATCRRTSRRRRCSPTSAGQQFVQ